MNFSRIMAVAAVALLTVATASISEARPRHHHRSMQTYTAVSCDNSGRPCGGPTPNYQPSSSREGVISGRHAGCPRAFCGCEASIYKFGKIIPELNLAANWIRKFPRTSPAPGMAAARRGHVMILMSHVGGSVWHVHDGNSGHHLTREHDRSIAGYVVVDPSGSRYASR